jgi:hypothetical protein
MIRKKIMTKVESRKGDDFGSRKIQIPGPMGVELRRIRDGCRDSSLP